MAGVAPILCGVAEVAVAADAAAQDQSSVLQQLPAEQPVGAPLVPPAPAPPGAPSAQEPSVTTPALPPARSAPAPVRPAAPAARDSPRTHPAPVASCEVMDVVVSGPTRLNHDVVLELLPREPPACYSDEEIGELERRLWSLAIFDDVRVERARGHLLLSLREKWTLIPGADLATGDSLEDSFFLLSVTESNLFARAQSVQLYGFYAERSFGGEIFWFEHESAARRITFEGQARYYGSAILFEHTDVSWEYRRTAGRFGARLPFSYGSQWRFALLAGGYHEASTGELPGELSDEGGAAELGLRITWDAYEWHDLAPHGARVSLELIPGLFFTSDDVEHRHSALLKPIFSLRFTDTIALMLNTAVEAVNPGHPNHSMLIGTLRGVRGLPDNTLHNTAQAFANLELRFASALARRWYLQGVGFVDAGSYYGMNEAGETGSIKGALSTGIGLRIIPTWLAGIVARADVGSLLVPKEDWFVTFGISQYFF